MKQFLIKISYTVFPMWLAVIGLVCFYDFVIVPNMQGDLGGLGKIPMKLYYEKGADTVVYENRISTIYKIETIKNDTFDIITCGDSFSQLGLYGYQNYMSSKGLSIINYFPYGPLRWNPFQAAFDLMNLGYIDSTNVNVLIIESVERSLLSRLQDLDFHHIKLEERDEVINHSDGKNPLLEAKTYLDFRLGLKENPVKHLELNKPCFTGTHGQTLYFYCDDIADNGFSIPEDSYDMVKANVDSLFKKAFSKNIHLMILICPDKYDIYQDYIVNNPYPKKTINEDFRRIVGNRQDIIIGKEILLPYINKEMTDMYYFDDTHWSFKSAKLIADTLSSIYHNLSLDCRMNIGDSHKK